MSFFIVGIEADNGLENVLSKRIQRQNVWIKKHEFRKKSVAEPSEKFILG